MVIVDGPIDCDTFQINGGKLEETDQQITPHFFIADKYANQYLEWEQVKCTQFIYDITELVNYYFRIEFGSNSAILYDKGYNGNYQQIHYFDKTFVIPYDSVNGEIGVLSNSRNVDFYLDSDDDEIEIKIVNVTFDGAILSNDEYEDDKYIMHSTSNSWGSQNGKTQFYIYGDKSDIILRDSSKVSPKFQDLYQMKWSENDNNYFLYDSIYHPENSGGGDGGGGLKKSTIIIIAVVCAVVVVAAIIIIVVVVVKKRKNKDKSSSEQE